MPRYVPPSIEQIGLKKYLDDTAHMHDGYDLSNLVKMLDQGINKSNIGRLFKVDRQTIKKWIDINNKELAQNGPKN